MMICGSCGMRMDGRAVLACKERMQAVSSTPGSCRSISAMGNLPVIKDLVVDMEPFWQKMRAMKPYLQPGYVQPPEGKEFRVSPDAVRGDPQGGALHQLRLLRLRVQLDGVRSGVPRPGRARQGDALRRRRPRPVDRRAARGVQLRARDLGLHALLLLPGALPEGRRPARRDRQARRRVDRRTGSTATWARSTRSGSSPRRRRPAGCARPSSSRRRRASWRRSSRSSSR